MKFEVRPKKNVKGKVRKQQNGRPYVFNPDRTLSIRHEKKFKRKYTIQRTVGGEGAHQKRGGRRRNEERRRRKEGKYGAEVKPEKN